MRDYLGEEAILRSELLEKIKASFELFGFQPLETPALESWDVLSAKGAGGEEILEETYNFTDKAGRRIGLRYDLTVPLARVVASNPTLPLPYKRYQIGKVWRYGEVGKGRLREFTQCDIDIIGSEHMISDAEVITCAVHTLKNIGIDNFIVRLNNRKLLNSLVRLAGVPEEMTIDVLRAIDKIDKIELNGVIAELKKLDLTHNTLNSIVEFLKIRGKPSEVLTSAKDIVKGDKEGEEGVEELNKLLHNLKLMGSYEVITIDLSLARGLDYYTGPIFEFVALEGVGSITSGGRYDNLIKIFSGKQIPATGISLGLERIIEVLKETKEQKPKKTKTQTYIAATNDEVRDSVIEVATLLRQRGIKTDYDLKIRKLTRQLEYAASINVAYVIIVGKEELSRGAVKLRNMQTWEEKEVQIEQLHLYIK